MQSYRNDDPTSKAAMLDMIATGRLSERRAQVLYLVTKYPNYTAGELAGMMVREFSNLPVRAAVGTPNKRLAELNELGLVFKSGTRECRDTGNVVYTWKLVNKP